MSGSSGGEQLQQPVPQGKGLGIFDTGNGQQLDLLNHIKASSTPVQAATSSSQGAAAKKANRKPKEEDDQSYTTVMLRNIPNKYTRQMLVDELDKAGFVGDVDYLYLPTDFTNRCNVGYCFCNFRTVSARQRFQQMFDGKPAQTCLPGFNSYKVCQVTRAKWQGRAENVKRLKSSPELMLQLAAHPEWLPVLMNANGEKETFPLDDEASAAGQSAKQRKKRAQASDKPSAPMPGFPFQVPFSAFPQPEAMTVWQQMAGLNLATETGGGRGNGRGRGKAGSKGKGRGPGNVKSVSADSQAQMAKAYGMAGMPMPMPMMGAFPPMVFDQSMLAMQGLEGYDANSYLMNNFYPMMPMEAYANLAASTQALAGYSPDALAGWGEALQAGMPDQEEEEDD